MPDMNVQVALSEVLEVKGAPLQETEIWALLYQMIESLQDLFGKGHAVQNQGPAFALTPDTVMINSQGLANFADTSFDSVRNQDFEPPEWNPREYFSDEEVEKIYVFSLGVCIYTCADYKLGRDETLDISDELDTLLGDMCEDEPTHRMCLADILHTCSEHSRQQPQRISNTLQLQQLYKLVLGSDVQLNDILDSDIEHHLPRAHRSRKTRSQERPKSAGAQPRSRSRSKHRSRSQSADRKSLFSPSQPRPIPLGRDQASDYNDVHRHKYQSISNLYNNGHNNLHGGYPAYIPPYFGSQPNLFAYDHPYIMTPQPAIIPTHPGRKIVGHSMKQNGPYYPHGGYSGFRSVPLSYEADEGFSSQASLIKDPHVRQTYERLKERQKKLQALRKGVEYEEFDSPDAFSSGSEAPTELYDRRSIASVHSYTTGAYRPDLLEKRGLSKALQMGHDSTDVSPDEQDISWLQKQEKDIIAMQRALDNFTGPKNVNERQSRSRTKTPVGSRASSKQRSQPQQISRPPSRQRSGSKSSKRSQSQGRRKVPSKIPRKFYGPEFIQSERVIPVTVPTIKTTNQSHLRHVFVHLLNGDKLDVTCEANTLAKDLFDAVVAHLALPEHYLFGITFSQESEYFFMDPVQKLSKMAPSHWKDPGKGRPNSAWTTYFKVKFYVENVNVLQHPVTRHLFYLQLRKDMLEGKVHCTEDQALSMSGYAMQAEYGDWYDKSVGFIPEMYLPPPVMKRIGKTYAKENIPKQHELHCGVSDEKSQIMFIKEVQQLQEYGMHFYKIYTSKKHTGNPIWAGVSVQGIVLTEQRENAKVVIQRHPWQFTQKVSFSRKRFSITPKSDAGRTKVQKLNYYTDSYKKGRYLLHLCTAHHRFQIMMKQNIEPNIQFMIQEDEPSEAAGSDYDDDEIDYDDEEEVYDEDEIINDDDYQDDGHNDLYHDQTYGSQDTVLHAPMNEQSVHSHYENLPLHARPRSRLSSKDGLSNPTTPVASRPTSRPASRPVSRPVSRPTSRPTTPGAHVIDVSIRSHDSELELDRYLSDNELDWLSESLTQKLENYPGATVSERRIVIVELHKEPQYGIGLTIVGGENTGKLDLGIFVKSITPGGPAHSHGNVNPGDRIIAINGQSLEGTPHHKAVEMIRDSPDVVQLLISQPVQAFQGKGILETDSDASLMDDLDSNRHTSRLANQKFVNNTMNQIEEHRSNSVTLSQLNSLVERSPSVNSSDLELEDVVPAEALQPQYVELHKSPVSPYMNAEMYRQQAMKIAEGRRSAELLLAERSTTPRVHQDEHNGYISDEELEDSQRKYLQQQMKSSDHEDVPLSSPEPPSMQSTARSEVPENLDHLRPGDRYEILLKKKDNSLGLNVAGGSNTTVRDGGIYVKSLAEKGAAELDGRIHVGDKVLEVNGVSLYSVTHKQAVETLRSAPPVCHLLMIRGVPPSSSKMKVSSPTPMASPSLQEDVTIPSSVRTDEGVTSPSAQSETTFSSSVNERAIDVAPEDDKVVPEMNNDVYDFMNEANTYAVQLEKKTNGLGFSVLGGSDVHPDPLHCLVRVKKIFSHGPAYDSGLHEGDVILQVDNMKLRDLTNKEVMTVLRTTPSQVRLIVCRPEAGVLPSMEELRRDLLDNTMDSESGVPVAISTPTADLVLNDQTPSFTKTNESYYNQPSDVGEDEVFSDGETPTPRGIPRADDDDTEYQTEATETYGTETPLTSHRSETTTARTTPRTPSPVKTFMQDAGLGSYETTPAVTPSVEYVMSPRSDRDTTGEDTEGDMEDMDEDEQSPQIFQVTLTKGEKGLGFTVAGGQQTTGFFYVKDVLFNPALADGHIQKGDRLIMVNGQDMTGLNHHEAVNYLRQTPQTVNLIFERPPDWEDSDGTPTPVPSPDVIRKAVDQGSAKDQSKEPAGIKNLIKGLESSQKIIKPYEYNNKNKQRDDQDIDRDSLEGDISPRGEKPEQKKTIEKPARTRVKTPRFEVTEAKDEAPVRSRKEDYTPTPEDDGDNNLNTSRDDVMSTVSSFGNITLPMSDLEDHRATPVKEVKQGATRSNVTTPESHTAVIRVELRKPPQGSLGFTLVQGEKGTSSALFLRSIASGGVAERDGRLKIGDKLLQVNGESVIGMAHNKAVALIKKASGTLTLAVSRATSKSGVTPAATPSKELDEMYKKQMNNMEKEKQATLEGLMKSVKAGDDKQADTDSDVDSTTLDDDAADDWGSSPRSAKTATTLGDTSDGELDDKFNEGSMAYKHFMESKGGVKRESTALKMPQEPPPKEKKLTRFNRVPAQITDTWLSTLDLVVPPKDNLHYSGRQLQITLKALKVKVERDDPVEEYKSLRHHKLTDNCIEARKPENKGKNRYRNVLPYDATRVRLLGPDDYINANHVKYQVNKHSMLHYIATQGPMPETTGDFWRMIWELKVEVIAMVTQDMEGGKVKCHRYWPDSMTTPFTVHNRYEVSLMNVQRFEHYDIHRIKLVDTEEEESHIVSHLNFTTWPDHGTPDSGLPLMQYIKVMHMLHDSGPIVVHCSAGIGRTGALIAIDVCRALIESDNKFDIQKIVQDTRRQRQGMIQTKDQYRFCYKTIMETLIAISKENMSVRSMGDTM